MWRACGSPQAGQAQRSRTWRGMPPGAATNTAWSPSQPRARQVELQGPARHRMHRKGGATTAVFPVVLVMYAGCASVFVRRYASMRLLFCNVCHVLYHILKMRETSVMSFPPLPWLASVLIAGLGSSQSKQAMTKGRGRARP